MTIRTKLILWYSTLLAIIIVFMGVAVVGVMQKTLLSLVDSSLDETADQISEYGFFVWEGTFSVPTLQVRVPADLDIFRTSGVMVQAWKLIGESGIPQLEDRTANLPDYYDDPLDPAALGLTYDHYSNVVIHGTELRVLTRPIMMRGQLWGNIQIAASLQIPNQALDKLVGVILISGALGVLGSVGLGTWLSDQTLRPIEAITEAASRIAATDDLSTRLVWQGPMDELGRLTSVFNRMMERLEHLFNVQRRFVADVSHELRTPLTAIRGNLDIIRRYGMDVQALEAIQSEAERMSRLVNDLLLLARADYGGLTLDFEPLDLDTIVSEVYKDAAVLAKDRDLKIAMGRFEPARISGNPDRVKQLLLNLVSNAIKFTPEGGQITLHLYQRDDGRAVIQVQDTGVGINAEDLQRIFDRFYQAEPSRARADGSEGSGLGLSIAKWIAEVHRGTINVESVPGQGSTFTFTLPLLEPKPEKEPPEKTTRPRLPRVSRNWRAEKASEK